MTKSFVQMLIPNPLKISGYKLDIGIYVLVASSEPLRIYVLDGERL